MRRPIKAWLSQIRLALHSMALSFGGAVTTRPLDRVLGCDLRMQTAGKASLVVLSLEAGDYEIEALGDQPVRVDVRGPRLPRKSIQLRQADAVGFQLGHPVGFLSLTVHAGHDGAGIRFTLVKPALASAASDETSLLKHERFDDGWNDLGVRELSIKESTIALLDETGRTVLTHHVANDARLIDQAEQFDRFLPALRTMRIENPAVSKAASLRPSLQFRVNQQGEHLTRPSRKIGVLAHDFKFVSTYISYLKAQGHQVRVAEWKWGQPKDLLNSRRVCDWADTVFCEWGLANAVWASHRLHDSKKLVVRIHAQEIRSTGTRLAKCINAANVSRFIFVSEHIRAAAIEKFGWSAASTSVVPNFVLPSRFSLEQWPRAREAITLGMVGMAPASKRVDRALDLLEHLLDSGVDATLRIKGHAPDPAGLGASEAAYFKALYERVEQAPRLLAAVKFDEWGHDMPTWYQSVDFILSPSDHESFHYGLADGVLAGCIPIVWPWEGADDLFDRDWIVSSPKEAALRVMNMAAEAPDTLEQIRLENRRLVERRYSFETVFEELNRIILGDPPAT